MPLLHRTFEHALTAGEHLAVEIDDIADLQLFKIGGFDRRLQPDCLEA